jgi:hypothetical protein
MSDALKKVKNGEPLRISAGAYNTFVDAANDYLARKHNGGAAAPLGQNSQNIVHIKNNTSSAVQRLGVLGISSSVIPAANEYFKQATILLGDTPSATSHSSGRFAVTLEPIPAGGTGRAYISGQFSVKVNVTSESHLFADIKNGDTTQLQSAESGSVSILWKESGTGTKWAIVRFGASSGAGIQWVRIYDNAVNPMLCYTMTFVPPSTWNIGSAVYVYPHPSITASGIPTHYPNTTYTVAVQNGSLWIAAYTFPFPFAPYETVI